MSRHPTTQHNTTAASGIKQPSYSARVAALGTSRCRRPRTHGDLGTAPAIAASVFVLGFDVRDRDRTRFEVLCFRDSDFLPRV